MKLSKKWIVREYDPSVALQIASELNLSKPIARMLSARGFTNSFEAMEFLDINIDSLENPFLLPDMEKAVQRVQMALKRKEKVFIAGDRDTDGITSTTLLVNLMELIGLKVSWSVPRPEDGYGLSKAAVDSAADFSASLLLTCDCGIKEIDGVESARAKGMDVIVLDHHEPSKELPRAWAIVDAKRADSKYPFSELSACGVAFKFAQALLLGMDPEFFGKEIVFFDVETTGMSAGLDEIIEIAGMKTRNGVELDRFHSLIKPECSIPASLTEIHGLTEEMLKNSPPASEVIPKFLDFIGDSILAGHNVSFDIKFLTAAAKKCCGKTIRNDSIDTLSESRMQFPAADHKLSALTKSLKIAHEDAHRAMSDVEAVRDLYKRLLSRRNAKLQFFLKNNLDLVALSTLADLVPLKSENRILVKKGLDALTKSARPGVAALREGLIGSKKITAKDVGWTLAPLLNAAGRMGKASMGVELLLCKDEKRAKELVGELSAMNSERKTRTRTNEAAALLELEKVFVPERDAAVVLSVKDIEHGVTGLVATRILHYVGKPTVLFIDDGNEILSGTSRTIPEFDIVKALEKLSHLLEKFGGHSSAAGVSLKRINLEKFRKEFNELVRSEVPEELLMPRLYIDADVAIDELNLKLLEDLLRLEPTGNGNEQPVFCSRGVEVKEATRMGDNGKHLKIVISSSPKIEAVMWNAELDFIPKQGEKIDITFKLEKNEWAGKTSLQCLVEDIKPAVKRRM
ncbi:MAG: single-stranded-DNA-specific exonuclease RecJ [Candidatus Hydrogenedentes bacterium CG07_land_8_20_14_0_80_42_17]|nr:MAG: single-stranded-DNA-specific exonuclease RecJ [Candidatus Hydrogenedentes bacterium CG07_land_8_20_14_0_80_42_17]